MNNGYAAAFHALMCSDPVEKIARVRALAQGWSADDGVDGSAPPAEAVPVPGRPLRPELVAPRALKSRGLGSAAGRAAMVHAVAHIEFNAINLAVDAVYRFRGMPADYYRDWLSVAVDEARHFELLTARLADLGHAYGDFPAHNGLWEAACKTADSCLQRMALVPRVLEARGLDVTPAMIERLRFVGDDATVEILQVILREEVAHVEAGTRWFRYCCAQQGVEPESTFLDLVRMYSSTFIRRPFNESARVSAGFSELERLGLEQIADVVEPPAQTRTDTAIRRG